MKLTIDFAPADDEDYEDALRAAAESVVDRASYVDEEDYETAIRVEIERAEAHLKRWRVEPWGDIRIEFDLETGSATVKDCLQ